MMKPQNPVFVVYISIQYQNIPHLLCPVIINPDEASVALKKLIEMMDERNALFRNVYIDGKQIVCKDLDRYNQVMETLGKPKLKRVVVIMDEFQNIILANREVEGSLQKLTSLARSAGIHIIIATQRPSTEFITGSIKANVPSAIAFRVKDQTNSRIILDENGAEQLLGAGDMLLKYTGNLNTERLQNAFIDDIEVGMKEFNKEYIIFYDIL